MRSLSCSATGKMGRAALPEASQFSRPAWRLPRAVRGDPPSSAERSLVAPFVSDSLPFAPGDATIPGMVAKDFSWISKMFCAGTGSIRAAVSSGQIDCRGHGASRGNGTPRPAGGALERLPAPLSILPVPIRQRGSGQRAGIGKNEIRNFRPVRDRHVFRRRMQLPLLRLGRRRRQIRRRRHHMDDAIAARLQLCRIRGKAATVRAWMSCSSRMPLPLASIRLIARS